MAFDDDTLLRLRRQFSGQEKYKLFLQQLNRLEAELKLERELNTKLMKENLEFKDQCQEIKRRNNELNQTNGRLKTEIGEYAATEMGKKFVTIKAYNKLQKSHQEWERRFWELHIELQKLKQSSPK